MRRIALYREHPHNLALADQQRHTEPGGRLALDRAEGIKHGAIKAARRSFGTQVAEEQWLTIRDDPTREAAGWRWRVPQLERAHTLVDQQRHGDLIAVTVVDKTKECIDGQEIGQAIVDLPQHLFDIQRRAGDVPDPIDHIQLADPPLALMEQPDVLHRDRELVRQR